MKIIDAHLHIFNQKDHAEPAAQLRRLYGETGIVHGVIMGNYTLDPDYHDYPADLFHYCVGLDSNLMDKGRRLIPDLPDLVEANLKKDSCCGVKLYPGYNRIWLTDPIYTPIYELAARYDKPVAVHMGLTAFPGASLKYCHPLALDEAAADNPRTRFVMCHFGNPFLESAAAVLEKNHNVSTDLSGLLEGPIDLEKYFAEQKGYADLLRTWLKEILRWDGILFGTDWPIVNLADYIGFVKGLVPEERWEAVFFENANRVYGLGL